jgi:uncharacterized protein (DUF2235 family)
MPKRIAFCFDGTWQAPLNGTNVYRLYKALTVTSDQVTYYDDGVGADATGLNRIIQGAFGQGLLQKIQDGYTKIAHVYEDGDEIYLFGFSRGAYTARCVAGMIANCGLPRGTFTDDCVTKAFQAYRDPKNRATILAGLGPCNLGDASLRMVGVWDTVGALGIPAIFGQVDLTDYGFLDTGLHPDVKNAYHALAIDEHRPQFPATLWEGAPAVNQTIEQVWFSGCHGDVGGGTPPGTGVDGSTRLCDITFSWMLAKAQAVGLTFDPGVVAQFQNLAPEAALDKINDSYKPVDGPVHLRPIADDANVSNSVGIRVQYVPEYRPGNLKFGDDALADAYAQVNLVDAGAAVTTV